MPFDSSSSMLQNTPHQASPKGGPRSIVHVPFEHHHIPSMGMVYLPTFTIKNQRNVDKYSSPMDPMGFEHHGIFWSPCAFCFQGTKS